MGRFPDVGKKLPPTIVSAPLEWGRPGLFCPFLSEGGHGSNTALLHAPPAPAPGHPEMDQESSTHKVPLCPVGPGAREGTTM